MRKEAPKKLAEHIEFDQIKTTDLVYSLENKVINAHFNWFCQTGLAKANLEYKDKLPEKTFKEICIEITKRIPTMDDDELASTHSWLRVHIFSDLAAIAKANQTELSKFDETIDRDTFNKKLIENGRTLEMEQGIGNLKEAIIKEQIDREERKKITSETRGKIQTPNVP